VARISPLREGVAPPYVSHQCAIASMLNQ
jgi:hypothetical protein